MDKPLPLPLRVLLDVSKKSPLWSQLWNEPEEVFPQTISTLQAKGILVKDPQSGLPFKVVAKEKYNLRTYIVVDICHKNYDASTGHLLEQNKLAVAVVRFRGSEITAERATPGLQTQVNQEIAQIHDWTGWGSTPPFVTDRTIDKELFYDAPRSCVMEVQAQQNTNQT